MSDFASLVLAINSTQVPQGVAELDKLAAAGGRAETAAGKVTAATKDLTAAQKALVLAQQAGATISAKMIQDAGGMAAAERALVGALNQSSAAAVAHGAAVKSASANYNKLIADTKFLQQAQEAYRRGAVTTADATMRIGTAGKLASHEMLNLSRQFADIGTMVAMGQSPFMLLAQQGPQVADIFQTAAMRGIGFKSALSQITGSVGGLIARFGPMIAGFGLVTGAVGLVTAAFFAGEKESNAFANSIKLTGNYAGVTAGQFKDMAGRVAEDTGRGFGTARSVIQDLISTGRFAGQSIEFMADNIVRLADLSGKSTSDVTDEFTKMSDGVTAWATKAQQSYHLFSQAQLEYIRQLEALGKTDAAVTFAMTTAHEELARRGKANLGILEQAWRGVAGAIGSAWDALKDIGRASDEAEAKLAAINIQLRPGTYASQEGGMREQLLAQKAILEAKLAANKAETEGVRVQAAGVKAADELRTKWAGAGDNIAGATKEIQAYHAAIDALRKANPNSADIPSPSRQKAAEADIMRKFTPDATAAAAKAASAADSAAKAAARHAEQLALETQAMDATIAATLNLARAYGVSDVAALRAEAEAEAIGKAIRRKGDIDAFVQRQMDLNAAKAAAGGAERLKDLDHQTTAQNEVNLAMGAGTLTMAAANEQLQIEASLLPLIAMAKAAQGDAQTLLLDVVQKLYTAQALYNSSLREAQIIAEKTSQSDQLAMLQKELELIGATNVERARQLAILQKTQELTASGKIGMPGAAGLVKGAGNIAARSVEVTQAIENENKRLSFQLDLLNQIDDRAQTMASGLSSAFGSVGAAIGDLTTAMTGYAAKQEDIRVKEDAALLKAGKDEGARARITKLAAGERTQAELNHTASVMEATKHLFGEQTAAYKGIQAIQQAYYAFRFVSQAMAVADDVANTASSVANAEIRGAADGAAGAAKIFSFLGPFGFPVVAAMVAVLAGLGLKGLGGGGSAPSIPTAEDRQKAQGTGSTLGDSKAKSDSIAKSLEIVASNTNKDLEYSNAMLQSLRSIETGIGSVAAGLARSLNIPGGALSTDSLGLGATASGPGLLTRIFAPLSNLLPGLFGKKTTVTLQDLGLEFDSQSIANILAGGIGGRTYQEILTETKKKFLGVTVGGSAQTSTTTGALDADLSAEITNLIGSLKNGVLTAAGILGVTGAEAALNAFAVEIGKLSFKDMTGAEIEEALNAVFGKLGDDMARAAAPIVTSLQKVGEGALETLSRLAREYQVVDVYLSSIGKTFGIVGVESVVARDRLVEATGGLDAFAEKTKAYADAFFTDAEKLVPIQAAVTAEMARLGQAGVTTKEAFKSLVAGLDVSTEAGANLYAALLNVAPAFAKVADAANELASQRRSMEIDLMEATGRSLDALTARRHDELQALDASLRPLRAVLYATQDLAAAQDALKAANDNVASATTALADLQQQAADRAAQAVVDQLQKVADAAGVVAGQMADALTRATQGVDAARSALKASYDAEKTRLEATTQAVTDARSVLSGLTDTLKGFIDTLKAFWKELTTGATAMNSPAEQYRLTKAQFTQISSLPVDDPMRLAQLPGAGQAFAEASKAASPTMLAYQRDIASIKIATDASLSVAQATVDTATLQLNATAGVKDAVVTVQQAIDNLNAAVASNATAQAQLVALDASVAGLGIIDGSVLSVGTAILGLQVALATQTAAQAADSAAQANLAQAQLAATQAQTSLQAAQADRQAAQFAASMVTAQATLATAQATQAIAAASVAAAQAALGAANAAMAIANRPAPVDTVSAYDRTKSALLAGSQSAAAAYLNANPDLAGRYAHPTSNSGEFNPAAGESAIDFALRHFRTTGQFEGGRNLFASGAAFLGNGVIQRPTDFSMGRMGENGPEAIMPLVRGPQGLGVRAANDDGAKEEIRALRSEVASLRTVLAQIEANTSKTERNIRTVTQGGRAMQTEVFV